MDEPQNINPSLTPQEYLKIKERFGIKYMTLAPGYTPNQETDAVIYNDGSGADGYWLYIYANGAWRYINLKNFPTTFLGLTDTPNAYTGGTLKLVRVNAGETALEFVASAFKFGGTGADGALNISSGTTTLNMGGAQVFIKNYTSISITGTGTLAFSNPHAGGTIIILKSQGDVTLTSSSTPMIDAKGLGPPGGTGGTQSGASSGGHGAGGGGATTAGQSSGAGNGGNDGTTGSNYPWYKDITAPGGGTGGNSGAGSTGGSAGSTPTNTFAGYFGRYYGNFGAGGGGGEGGNLGAAGDGGRGGCILIMECAGAWNFTTANGISVAGGDAPARSGNGGGGGGGGGGTFNAMYNTLTANSGTVVVTGGTSSPGTGPVLGGDGISIITLNTIWA